MPAGWSRRARWRCRPDPFAVRASGAPGSRSLITSLAPPTEPFPRARPARSGGRHGPAAARLRQLTPVPRDSTSTTRPTSSTRPYGKTGSRLSKGRTRAHAVARGDDGQSEPSTGRGLAGEAGPDDPAGGQRGRGRALDEDGPRVIQQTVARPPCPGRPGRPGRSGCRAAGRSCARPWCAVSGRRLRRPARRGTMPWPAATTPTAVPCSGHSGKGWYSPGP